MTSGDALRVCRPRPRQRARAAAPPGGPRWPSVPAARVGVSLGCAQDLPPPPPAWRAGNPGSSRPVSCRHSDTSASAPGGKRKEGRGRAERRARLAGKREEGRGSGLFSHLVIRKRDFSSVRSPHFWTAWLLPRAHLGSHLTPLLRAEGGQKAGPRAVPVSSRGPDVPARY